MPNDTSPLFMVQLHLDLPRLLEAGQRLRLPPGSDDLGYLLHCQLKALFADLAPQPFRPLGARHRWQEVIGYARADAARLERQASAFAAPAVYRTVDWGRIASKPFPTAWPIGSRLGFEVRVCPVVRKASRGEHHEAGAEVDAFLSRSWEVGRREVAIDRGEVYREWLRQGFDRGGAELRDARLTAFRQSRLLRRTQGARRTTRPTPRPDAVLRGELEVQDAAAFGALLSRGVGRHRAFGFGMLLLRPAGGAPC